MILFFWFEIYNELSMLDLQANQLLNKLAADCP